MRLISYFTHRLHARWFPPLQQPLLPTHAHARAARFAGERGGHAGGHAGMTYGEHRNGSETGELSLTLDARLARIVLAAIPGARPVATGIGGGGGGTRVSNGRARFAPDTTAGSTTTATTTPATATTSSSSPPSLSSLSLSSLSRSHVTGTATATTTATMARRKTRRLAVAGLCTPCVTLVGLCCVLYVVFASGAPATLSAAFRRAYHALQAFDWRASAAFRVTHAMKVSIAMSLALGVLLGVGVGLISGLEPAVVIGVSASMAMGCVFVMSFAILHGVNALRAVTFALFVSVCLPFGFGVGFGIGILVGVFLGLEDPDDIRDKTADFVYNFGDFVRVVTAFTMEIM